MTVNKIVSATDYNNIRDKVLNIMGSGSATTGYGQSLGSSALSEGNKITVNEWTALAKDIQNIYKHQNGSVPVLAGATANTIIRSDSDQTTLIGSISGSTLSVSEVSVGMLAVGQVVTGASVPNGTTITAFVSGSPWGVSQWTISTSTNLSSRSMSAEGITEYPYLQYDRLFDGSRADDLVVNRFKIASGQSITESKGIASILFSPTGADPKQWNTNLRIVSQVSFLTATSARHFFNSGGEVRFSSSRSGGDATSQNADWSNILASFATFSLGGNLPASGTSLMDAKNWYRLTGAYQVIYTGTGSSPYGNNVFKLSARAVDAIGNNNSTGTATTAQFYFEYIDGYVDPAPGQPPAPGDLVNGTFEVSASVLKAYGTLDPSSLGNFTVDSPSINFGAWESEYTSPPEVNTTPTFYVSYGPSNLISNGWTYSGQFNRPYSTTLSVTCTSGSGAFTVSRGTIPANCTVQIDGTVGSRSYQISNGATINITLTVTSATGGTKSGTFVISSPNQAAVTINWTGTITAT